MAAVEKLDVLDEAGKPTGKTKTKDQILRAGDWRQVVHIWVVDSTQRLLIQQRAAGRGIFDSLWDVSVGGGVRAGEPTPRAARRELREELGLKFSADELVLLGTWKIPPKKVDKQRTMKDFSDTFLVHVPSVEALQTKLQPDEVQRIGSILLPELVADIEHETFYASWVPHGQAYYREVARRIIDMV